MLKENTLIINSGSSSVKFRLYSGNMSVLEGKIEGIGSKASIIVDFQGAEIKGSKRIKTYSQAARFILDFIDDTFKGIKIDKIAYRVVHGGNYQNHVIINDEVISNLKKLSELAPLHNSNSIEMIETTRNMVNAKHIACFDTVFFKDMPDVAKTYAIPSKLSNKYGIKRYGFHGLAHQYMMSKANGNIITCQLGNGVSISAIKNKKVIDTSMGFTPLEGLVMGTRSGNIDPSIVAFLSEKEHKSPREIINILQKESGLKGIAGDWDVRNLIKRKDAKAKLALNILVYNIKKYIGAYSAILGRVDCVVLGGGMSKNPEIVKRVKNGFKTKFLVVDTDEQEVMFEISKKF